MVHLCRCLLVLFALTLGERALAAPSQAELKAFKAATDLFNISSWETAEKSFAEFIQKFPDSKSVPEALLYQARARFKLSRNAGIIELLSAHPEIANQDEYFYWLAEAHFQSANYAAAADAFARLANGFINSPRRLEGAVGEAASRARLAQWP